MKTGQPAAHPPDEVVQRMFDRNSGDTKAATEFNKMSTSEIGISTIHLERHMGIAIREC